MMKPHFTKYRGWCVILLAVIMPNKNGRKVYDEIKQIRPDIKMLFMSGHPADIIHKHGILENGFAYISKNLLYRLNF